MCFFPAEADLIIIAGDSMNGFKSNWVDWLLKQTAGTQVLMVLGNHDCYYSTRDKSLQQFNAAFEGSHIRLLQNQSAVIAGIRFCGTDLWTDFDLNGQASLAKQIAQNAMNDFTCISVENSSGQRPLTPDDMQNWHREARCFIANELHHSPQPLILITHHGLSRKSIAPMHIRSELNPAFVSDLEPMFNYLPNKPIATINGHCHHYVHDKLACGALLYANPRGYGENELRQELLVVDSKSKIVRLAPISMV